ncbi:MAG: alpha/beta hydrolase [Acidimicrobiia bacterium]|nr:alpha/beta hydrolase [Acidimicrobiia bacterium]
MKKIVGLVVGGWLGWRVFGPEFAPRFEAPQRHPARLRGRSVFVGEREFFVREAGNPDGPVLFMLHGWGYASIATWYRTVEYLGDHFRLILMDQRNHGGSARIRGRFSIDDLADDAAGVMDALELGRVAVAGYSMGGMVAQSLARRHPEKVASLALGATAAYPIPTRRLATRVAFAIARGLGRVSLIEWARATHGYLLRSGAVEAEHARWLWEGLLDRDSTLSFESGAAVWPFDSREWVSGLDVSSLVIIPTADQLVPPQRQRELAELLRAEVVELPGAKHEAVLTHGDDIAKAIIEFAGGSSVGDA